MSVLYKEVNAVPGYIRMWQYNNGVSPLHLTVEMSAHVEHPKVVKIKPYFYIVPCMIAQGCLRHRISKYKFRAQVFVIFNKYFVFSCTKLSNSSFLIKCCGYSILAAEDA